MGLNTETEVTQDFRPQPVAQTNVLEPNHVSLRRAAANTQSPSAPESTLYSNAHRVGVDDLLGPMRPCACPHLPRSHEPSAFGFPLVSGPLTNGLLACRRVPLAGANADADHLHKLRNLLSGRGGLARADWAVGPLRPLQADVV